MRNILTTKLLLYATTTKYFCDKIMLKSKHIRTNHTKEPQQHQVTKAQKLTEN